MVFKMMWLLERQDERNKIKNDISKIPLEIRGIFDYRIFIKSNLTFSKAWCIIVSGGKV